MAKKFNFQLNPLEHSATREILRTTSNYREIPLDLIDFDPDQPRKQFDQTSIEELAQSIREVGLLTPILVREKPEGRFVVISGERRVRASRLANLNVVPAIVYRHGNDELKRLISQIVENVQREDLKPLEKARAFAQLRDNFGLSIRQISERVGVSKSQVQRSLQLLDLPNELHRLLLEGVSESKVLELAKLKQSKLRLEELANKSRAEIRNIRAKVSGLDNPKVLLLVKQLESVLGKRVSALRRKNEIVLSITFDTPEDLTDFVELQKRLFGKQNKDS